MKWRKFCYLLSSIMLVTAGGCSDRKVHEFTSRDGKVAIGIFDPCECDQQKTFYAEVRNLQLASGEYARFSTEWGNCGDSFDPSSLVWLEGEQWCGVFASSIIDDVNEPLSQSLYGLVDRERRRVIHDFDGLPVAIRSECLTQLEQCRKQRNSGTGATLDRKENE
jgi:hypothetical protein